MDRRAFLAAVAAVPLAVLAPAPTGDYFVWMGSDVGGGLAKVFDCTLTKFTCRQTYAVTECLLKCEST